MTSEKNITDKIIGHLRSQGFWVRKLAGGPRQRKGLPDVLAIRDGRAFFFEVKQPDRAVTKLQAKVIGELREHGAVAESVTSLEEVKVILDSWNTGRDSAVPD